MAPKTLGDLFPQGLQPNFFSVQPVSVFALNVGNADVSAPQASSPASLAQTPSQPTNYLNSTGTSENGPTNLKSIFSNVFGPQYMQKPDVKGLLQGLDNQLTNQVGASNLGRLLNASKRVTDYISANQALLPGPASQRVAT